MGVPASSGGRAGALRAEPATQSQAKPLVPNADDLRLLRAGPDGRGAFEFALQSSAVPIIAGHLAEMMRAENGAWLNCVEIGFNHEELGRLTLTMQRATGKQPMQLKAEAEALLKTALDAIETGRSEPLFIARDAIRNYFEDQLKPAAQGIVAATAGETEGLDERSEQSPVAEGDAPKEQP